jgi:hypothetical protein
MLAILGDDNYRQGQREEEDNILNVAVAQPTKAFTNSRTRDLQHG